MQLNMKEFRLRPTKYLEDIVDELVLTKRGKPFVTITKYISEDVCTRKVAQRTKDIKIPQPRKLDTNYQDAWSMINKKK